MASKSKEYKIIKENNIIKEFLQKSRHVYKIHLKKKKKKPENNPTSLSQYTVALWYICTMEYYSARKMNELLATYKNMLHEKRCKICCMEKDVIKYYMILFV